MNKIVKINVMDEKHEIPNFGRKLDYNWPTDCQNFNFKKNKKNFNLHLIQW